jgi:hypothetical protein
MTDLHAAFSALAAELLATNDQHDRSDAAYHAAGERIRALLAEHEPTPSDQALRDLRAAVEAHADPDRMPSGVIAFATRQDRMEISRYIQHILASSAPATASEGVEGTTEPGRNSSASEGAKETRDKGLADYLAKMDNAGGGIYTSDFRDGFRHALAMLAAYETPAEPDQIRPEVREAARMALSLRATGVSSSDAATDQPPGVQVDADAATPVTSPDGEREVLLAQVRSAERAAGRWARENEDAQEVSVALAEVASYLAARTAQPESTERVEWGVRSLGRVISNPDWRQPADVHHWNEEGEWVRPDVVLRRTVTTYAPVVGPWEAVEDTTGGDDRG